MMPILHLLCVESKVTASKGLERLTMETKDEGYTSCDYEGLFEEWRWLDWMDV